VGQVKGTLLEYCQASGQHVNMAKSSIHFSKGCGEATQEEIKRILDVHNEALSENTWVCLWMLEIHPMVRLNI
jgi:hypothetical protein